MFGSVCFFEFSNNLADKNGQLLYFNCVVATCVPYSWCHGSVCIMHNGHQTYKISKGAKIKDRYNQVPHLTQETNGKVTNSQLDTTNESQEVSPFPACDHKAHINRRTQRHSEHKTEQKHKRSTKEVPPWNGQ